MRSRMILRCAALFAAAFAVPAAHVLVAPSAAADDKKKDDKTKKDAAQIAREKNLREIAASFEKKDVSAMLARVPKDQKLSLYLDGKEGDYSVTQAKSVLGDYFKDLDELTVDTSVGDKSKVKYEVNVGYFPLKAKKKAADKAKDGTLGVTLGEVGADGVYTLRKLRVDEK